VSPGTRYPLSFQQLTELDEYDRHPDYATGSCWVYLFRLDPGVDLDDLAVGLHGVVRRHASLRTVVRSAEAEPSGAQWVDAAEVREPLAVQSFDSVEALAQHVSDSRPAVPEIRRGTDLFVPRVFAVGGLLYLSIIIQHLIFDGLSLGVFVRDLGETYAAAVGHRTPRLPPPPASYGDFALDQHRQWREHHREALPFWSSELAGYDGVIRWPTPRRPLAAGEPIGARYHLFDLPAAGIATVRQVARASRVSPFMVLLAASGLAITRAFGQPDVVLGTDYANRPGAAFRETLGFFANTRFTRFDVRRYRSLSEAVGGVARAWSAANSTYLPPYGPLQQALGRFDFVKVGMEIPERGDASFDLGGAIREPVAVSMDDPYWRKLKLQWFTTPAGYTLSVKLQPTEISAALPEELFAQLSHVLDP
jgi:Condensation domain